MQFQWTASTLTLHGLHLFPIVLVDPQEMAKEARQGQLLIAILMATKTLRRSKSHTILRVLIDEFNEIFEMPTHLPPHQSINHHIMLKEGTNPIKIHPYHYAYYHRMRLKKGGGDDEVGNNQIKLSSHCQSCW